MLALTSCGSTTQIPVDRVVRDTVYVTVWDTVYTTVIDTVMRDSMYVSATSVDVQAEYVHITRATSVDIIADTVYIERATYVEMDSGTIHVHRATSIVADTVFLDSVATVIHGRR